MSQHGMDKAVQDQGELTGEVTEAIVGRQKNIARSQELYASGEIEWGHTKTENI